MSADVLAVLKSIDAHLAKLVVIAQQKAEQRVKNAQAQQPPASSSAPRIANEKDLDSKYGNPKVHFAPRDWPGEFTKGRQMSEYEPDFLDMLAEQMEYFADRDSESDAIDEYTKKPVKERAKYKRMDAARARGWAKRLRSGWKPPESDFGKDTDADADDDAFADGL